MAGPVAIRFALPDDAAIVLELIRALARYERMPDAVEVDEATLRGQLAERPPPFECLLAEHEARVVGFALFFHSYSTWRGKRGIWLEDLFVLPEARRAGVGRALLGKRSATRVLFGAVRGDDTAARQEASCRERVERSGRSGLSVGRTAG